MKHILLIAIIIGIGILTRAEKEYEVSGDGAAKVLRGLITRDVLNGDMAFRWFNDNRTGYRPNPLAVSRLNQAGDQVSYLIFGATWNEDTKRLLPRYIALLDAARIPESQLTIVGVDRNGETNGQLTRYFHITQTPAIILLRDGKEIGRLVGDGKKGDWELELAGIIDRPY